MGVSRSPAEFAFKIRSAGRAVQSGTDAGVTAAAMMVKRTATAEYVRVIGADMKMSGVGSSGARINVRFEPLKASGAHGVVINVRGPAHLIERDTKGHTIIPKGVGRAKGRTRAARRQAKQDLYSALFGGSGFSGVKPLRTPYGPRFRVQHPGTRGQYPWRKAMDKAVPRVPKTIQAGVRGHIAKAFS